MSKHAETLLIEGPDARAFAHAQFSSPVSSLAQDRWQFSAWLSAKGRVRAFFHLARLTDDKYLLLLRGGTAASMADELQRFVFRSKLTISAVPPAHILEGPAQELHAIDQRNGTLVLGCGSHSMQIVADDAVRDDFHSPSQLRMGWAWLPDSALGELLPGELSLQRLQAVAIDKGCYPGQEIVARLHFRGGQKRHLHSGTLSQSFAPGHVLRSAGSEAGRVLDVISDGTRHEALLVLTDDVAKQVNDDVHHLFDDDVQLRVETSWPA